MRRNITLETYDRRTTRLHSRREHTRRARVLTAVIIAAAVLAAAGAYALFGRPTTPAARSTQPAETRAAEPSPTAPHPAVADTEPVTAAPSAPPTITVAGVGDMLFDRNVKKLIQESGGAAPLARVAPRLAAADVAVGNLETTLADSGTRNPVKEPQYAFRGHPAGIQALGLAGFDAVSLANNHALDYGWEPLRDTIARLDSAGIGHAGAGENTAAAWKPATISTSSGANVAYLAFTHIVPAGFLAQQDRPGVASGKSDMGMIKDAIREAKKTHDYVIVSFHWGVEYADDANSDQVNKAHQVIDAGADMVLAHHPHVIEGVEFYRGRLIAYSLGDFVFDHYSRRTGEAFILEATLGHDGTPSARAVPVYLDGYGRPEYVTGSHAREILNRLKRLSAKRGTNVRLDGDQAVITP